MRRRVQTTAVHDTLVRLVWTPRPLRVSPPPAGGCPDLTRTAECRTGSDLDKLNIAGFWFTRVCSSTRQSFISHPQAQPLGPAVSVGRPARVNLTSCSSCRGPSSAYPSSRSTHSPHQITGWPAATGCNDSSGSSRPSYSDSTLPGTCHGDVSPSNIMKNESGDITLPDFGFAGRIGGSIPLFLPRLDLSRECV